MTFFHLGAGCDLTVTNTTSDQALVWYDGWMCNTSNFFTSPNYIATAVRDVFRVEEGAELTVNNIDIWGGCHRKVWMVNSFYMDRDGQTNQVAKLTYNGYAHEQIYGSGIVVTGGKVTINGGHIGGRGGTRNSFNVTAVPAYAAEDIENNFWGDISREGMVANCLTHRGAKAAVQIAGEGSTVIINDGQFYGNAGASKFSYTDSFKSNSYSVSMTDARNDRQVYCEITDAYGNTVRSNTVTLHMAVRITTQPKTAYTKQGAMASVTVKAAGDGLKYQWYVKNAGTTKWIKSSITTNTYSVKMTASTKDRQVY